MIKKTLLSFAALFTTLSLTNALAQGTNIEQKEPNLSCIQKAQWIAPKGLKTLNGYELIKQAASQKIVLLGEQHPDAVHHRWQLQTITQLYSHNPNLIIGFEMFPRRVQPVLEAWGRGELTEEEFLNQTDWEDVWKYDANLYMPIFRFARMNKLPIIALNVDQSLISEVSQKGWDIVEDSQKEGVKTPLKALPDYKESLKTVFSHHAHMKEDEKSNKRFNRFVQAQLTWDGAMAQKIAEVQKMGGDPLVVAIMGSGHIANGYGVPYQLEGLGLKATTLLPWTIGWDCDELTPTYADAIFGLEEMETDDAPYKPMLGVRIEVSENAPGVLVAQVIEESVAEDAGLQDGDIITSAAGLDVLKPAELIEIIQRQAPGTWLPLEINRGNKIIEIVAKFPQVEPQP